MTTVDKALAALSASIGKTLLPPSTPIAKDFGKPPDGLDPKLHEHLLGSSEALRELAGNLGDPLNRAVRLTDLINRGFADPVTFYPSITGVAGPVGPTGPAGPPGTYTPDATPPPTPMGLTATAGLMTIIIQWTVASYTQGHGPKQTNVYIVRKAASDPTLPTFPGAAGLAVAAPHALNIIDVVSDTNIRNHIWITFVTVDGYESVAPAGGTNGFVAQTGKIGNTDLGPLIITADKLSQGTYPNINLVANPGAEDGLAAWTTLQGVGSPTFSASTADKASGSTSFLIHKSAAGDSGYIFSTAFPVIPGETYSTKIKVKGSVASPTGIYVRMWEKTAKPVLPDIAVQNVNYTTYTDLSSNIAAPTVWTTFEYSYVVPAGIYWVSLGVINYIPSTALDLYFDDVSVGRQITASFLAAGAIAVGSLAVQNGAIVNAMIGLAAIDDARISSLSASKLTVGTGIIGGNLRSTNYAAGSAGWMVQPGGFAEFGAAVIRDQLVASQIDTRGLSIKDAAGNVILAAGNALDFNSRFSNTYTPGLPANYANRGDVGGYANSDPLLTAPNEWTFSSVSGANPNYYPGFNAGVAGLTNAWDKAAGGTAFIFGAKFPVSAFKTYVVESSLYMYGANTATHYLGLAFYDAAGVLLQGSVYPTGWPSVGTYHYYGLTGTVQAGVGASQYSIKFGALATPKIPVNAVTCQVLILGDYNNTADRWSWGGAQVREVVDGTTLAISASNVSTYIAAAAIGSAQIGVLLAGNLTVSALSNTINGSAVSGARVEVAANVVRVFDSSNVLRIKLGDLS